MKFRIPSTQNAETVELNALLLTGYDTDAWDHSNAWSHREIDHWQKQNRLRGIFENVLNVKSKRGPLFYAATKTLAQ